ncbi:hypothetical protein EIMP300_30040 [Escherichia coli]|uniref:Electron transfer flavoprotein alpha/beta-subunit N-terminal domain-containing protein n=6 Tax=Gammaproteobacteria TaxID=1236 RepID=A0A8S0FMJ9_ECOLX|nr:hypothetical protein EIMP300_30040 [Escherichia coli]
MNILLAFKAEPDAGMLAEKEWQAAAQGNSGPDVSLLRSLLGADEQAAAALLLAQRKNGTPMSLTALSRQKTSMGDERALHWLRYLMALGFEEAVLLETAADLRFAPEFVARHIAEWQRQNPLDLIITGCQSSEGQNGQTPFLLAEMLVWPCFTQVERFTLDAPFITLEQRTEHGVRCCRVRLPAVIAVRQCGEVALPVPGMRQRMAAGKAAIIRKTVAVELPAMQCLQLARAEQRRGATSADWWANGSRKSAKAMAGLFTPKDAAMNIVIVTINQDHAAIASWLAAQDFSGCTLAHWQIEPQPMVAEQVLDALVEQWQRTPADVVLFPPGAFGDELSTRLAWRLHGASICQVTSLDIPTVSVRKSHWGNALTATLQTDKRPLCLSLARQAGADKNATLPSGMQHLIFSSVS